MFLKLKLLVILAIVLLLGFVAYKTGLYDLAVRPWSRPERGLIMGELVKMKEINRLYTGSYLVPVLDVSYGPLKRDILRQGVSDLSVGSVAGGLAGGPMGAMAGSAFGGPTVGSVADMEPARMVPRGYCLKKYDVGFGYDDFLDLLQDEAFMARVCSGEASALPAPKILSVNSRSLERRGDYTGRLPELDQDQQLRMERIVRELNKSEALNKINERGRESLHSMASALCR